MLVRISKLSKYNEGYMGIGKHVTRKKWSSVYIIKLGSRLRVKDAIKLLAIYRD